MAYKLPSYISDYNFKSSELRKIIEEGLVDSNVDDYGNMILNQNYQAIKSMGLRIS